MLYGVHLDMSGIRTHNTASTDCTGSYKVSGFLWVHNIKFVSDLRQVSGFLWVHNIKFVSDLRQVSGFLWVHNITFVSDLRQVGGFLENH
jgi:hypothetical protein